MDLQQCMARYLLLEQTLIEKQTVDQDTFFSAKQNSKRPDQDWCLMSLKKKTLLRAVQVVGL